MDKVIVDGVEFRPVDDGGEKLRIVIVDNRGLTFVGRCSLNGRGEWIKILDARCIVYWGTTQHLAELVDGPTSKTRLGKSQTVTVRRGNIVAAYDCIVGGWVDDE